MSSGRQGLVLGAATVAATGLILAGCGGGGSSSSGVSANTYVASVCKATASWSGTTRSQSQQMEQQITAKLPTILASAVSDPNTALEPIRTSFVAFVGHFAGAAKTLQTQLHAAGTPDVKNGSTLAAGLNTAVDKLVAALTALRGQAQQIPTDNGPAFQQALTAIGTKLQSDFNGFQSSLSALNSSELTAAAKQTPACATLDSSG